MRPAPQGRAHRIRKRSNHVTLVVDNLREPVIPEAEEPKDEPKPAAKKEAKKEAKKDSK